MVLQGFSLVILPLEAGVGEFSLGCHVILGASQSLHAVNPAARYKVHRLGEVAGSPGHAGGKDFGVHLGAKLDTPVNAIRILDANLRVGAAHILLDEPERRLRSPGAASRTAGKIDFLHGPRRLPNDLWAAVALPVAGVA